MSDQPDHGRQREQEEREKPGRFRAEKMGISTSETTKSACSCAAATVEPDHRLAFECLMPISPELIHGNSQIYRIYTRSSPNPTDEDIFITSTGKLTAFLSDMTGRSTEESGARIDKIDLAILSLALTTFGLSCRSLLKFSTEWARGC